MTTQLPDPHQHATPDAGVRPARPTDAAEIGRVQSAVWRDAYAQDLPAQALQQCTPEAFAASWEASLSAPPSAEHLLLVAHEGGRIVGMLALVPAEDPDMAGVAEILELGVEPGARRRGHGSRLLSAAADLAREGSAPGLAAWVLAGHEETRAFLQGAGFAPDRARRERIVDEDGSTVLEARLTAALDREARGA